MYTPHSVLLFLFLLLHLLFLLLFLLFCWLQRTKVSTKKKNAIIYFYFFKYLPLLRLPLPLLPPLLSFPSFSSSSLASPFLLLLLIMQKKKHTEHHKLLTWSGLFPVPPTFRHRFLFGFLWFYHWRLWLLGSSLLHLLKLPLLRGGGNRGITGRIINSHFTVERKCVFNTSDGHMWTWSSDVCSPLVLVFVRLCHGLSCSTDSSDLRRQTETRWDERSSLEINVHPLQLYLLLSPLVGAAWPPAWRGSLLPSLHSCPLPGRHNGSPALL